jgi:hypothetical protein
VIPGSGAVHGGCRIVRHKGAQDDVSGKSHKGTKNMMRKLILMLAAVLALGSLSLTTDAYARGGGRGGGGGFHGGGGGFHGGGGGFHFGGGGYRGVHFGGFRGVGFGGFHRGFAYRGYAFHRGFAYRGYAFHRYAFHRGYAFRRYPFYRGYGFHRRFFVGYPHYAYGYGYGCYRWRHVLTPWGWRLFRVNVCRVHYWHRHYW